MTLSPKGEDDSGDISSFISCCFGVFETENKLGMGVTSDDWRHGGAEPLLLCRPELMTRVVWNEGVSSAWAIGRKTDGIPVSPEEKTTCCVASHVFLVYRGVSAVTSVESTFNPPLAARQKESMTLMLQPRQFKHSFWRDRSNCRVLEPVIIGLTQVPCSAQGLGWHQGICDH